MEYLYRIIVGIILTFTYFNIKGKKDKGWYFYLLYCLCAFNLSYIVHMFGLEAFGYQSNTF